MTVYACLACGERLPLAPAHRCERCGGSYSLPDGITLRRDTIDPRAPGIWRYRDSFGLPEDSPVLTLGEGNTPLVAVQLFGQELMLKLESCNPTGSYKDRLAAVMVSDLVGRGVTGAVEDSSGNAGAAFAAYAARAGMAAKVFVPQSASGPKRSQIERFGAEIVTVPGPRQAAADAVMEAVWQGAVYASHAYLPQGLTGVATIAYELVDDLGQPPGAVLAPAGHGGLLLGIALGFQALKEAGEIESLPDLVGVQALNNAPLWAAAGGSKPSFGTTAAEGIAVTQPARMTELLALHQRGVVRFAAVKEPHIHSGRTALSRLGIDAEPTSAVVWDAFRQTRQTLTPPVVAVISGHGLKA